VASERLLMRIKGVLPMASISPFLGFFSFFFERRKMVLLELSKWESMAKKMEITAAAATTPPVVLTGAIIDVGLGPTSFKLLYWFKCRAYYPYNYVLHTIWIP